MTEKDIAYGTVQTAEELGRLARAHRKQRRLSCRLEMTVGAGFQNRTA